MTCIAIEFSSFCSRPDPPLQKSTTDTNYNLEINSYQSESRRPSQSQNNPETDSEEDDDGLFSQRYRLASVVCDPIIGDKRLGPGGAGGGVIHRKKRKIIEVTRLGGFWSGIDHLKVVYSRSYGKLERVVWYIGEGGVIL